MAEDTTNLENNEPAEVVETTVLGSAPEEATEEVSTETVEEVVSKAPEKYELTLEGVELDAEMLEAADLTSTTNEYLYGVRDSARVTPRTRW